MTKSPPRSSTLELPTREDPLKSDVFCDRFVTGNSDLDNWIWILEYFAKFKNELWMLHDVFEMGPKLPDYLGEHTNEMVAFRCLSSLFDCSTSGQSKDVFCDGKSNIEFDSSESCEYVLQCILDEIPLSELKPGAPGLSKWNILPFLKSKLLSLPKCTLELMIEPSCEKDPGVSSCKGKEMMRSDGKEIDHLTPPMADPDITWRRDDSKSFCCGSQDRADEISRSEALFERKNEGFQYESDGYVSSPSENRYRCIQCKESGKLLFCSSDGCTVMVHQKCVDLSPPTFDDAGNFYCSLCAFTCAKAEYLQSQDEAVKAKTKLVSFLTLMSEVNKTKSIERI